MKTLCAQGKSMVKNGKPIDESDELLEDLHNLAVLVRRKDEPMIPIAEVKRRMHLNQELS